MKQNTASQQSCFHCGLDCESETVIFSEKKFCCRGCSLAYQILSSSGLNEYYRLNQAPGLSLRNRQPASSYAELDDDRILCRVCDFQNDRIVDVTLSVPQIHCTSCVWLLENLYRLIPGIRRSQVDSFRKTMSLSFERDKTSLAAIARTLDALGYAPKLNDVADRSGDKTPEKKRLLLKIGVAGFCFGNVMLLSLPDYLLTAGESLGEFERLFAYLTLLLSLPVFFFSASDYFKSAINALKMKLINIDVPLAIGLFALFVRSVYDVTWLGRIGYLDSFTGLVFFLLIGRMFKEKTFDTLNFERRYESYFPLALRKISDGVEKITPLSEVAPGDRLRLLSRDIVPADAVLVSRSSSIDYSFVTGEPLPQTVLKGELLYAGGRQMGEAIEIEVVKPVSQSHLTRLWNNSAFKETKRKRFTQISDHVGRTFTWVTLFVAVVCFAYWYRIDSKFAWPVVTSVLLVACPCALALAFPFTFGTAMRLLGRHGVYLKNMEILETLSWIDTVVFDKTGTMTQPDQVEARFFCANGQDQLSDEEKNYVASLAAQSSHPLSQALCRILPDQLRLSVQDFQEKIGQGLKGKFADFEVCIGSSTFVGEKLPSESVHSGSRVTISVNGIVRGYFAFEQAFRQDLQSVVSKMADMTQQLFLLSGDDERDRERIANSVFMGQAKDLLFRQSPQDKMDFVAKQMRDNHYVAMIGDGLNDAGALRQSDVGIAVTDDIGAFSPSSDLILAGESFAKLPEVFKASRYCVRVLYATIALSLVYNVIGLVFAATGALSPFVSAVLMPISSISVMSFSSTLTRRGLERLGFGVKEESRLVLQSNRIQPMVMGQVG